MSCERNRTVTAAMIANLDLVITVCDLAREELGRQAAVHWSVPDPVPAGVAALRASFWPHLLPVARDWAARLGRPAPWPDTFAGWLEQCHADGQQRPTPLLLSYGPGDWNALHQDLYGKLYFPMQVVIGLDAPGTDYAGGEFLLVEQRPRAQSRGTVTALGQGQALIFTTSERPVRSSRGWSASPVRPMPSRCSRCCEPRGPTGSAPSNCCRASSACVRICRSSS